MDGNWEPPSTLEERLRARLVPARLRMKYLLARELRRGEPEFRLLPFLVDRGRVALDIGANKGIWAEAMRPLAKKIYAFEPNPKIFRELARAAHPAVTLHNIALSDASGEAELRVPRGQKGYSNQGASLNHGKVGDSYGAVQVETRCLDDLDVGPVGFIKIDVEGHEMAVLDGARLTLARDRPALLIEIEEGHTRRPIRELLEQVCAHGYDALALRNGALCHALNIDLVRHHSNSPSRADYIFNWIFLPRC